MCIHRLSRRLPCSETMEEGGGTTVNASAACTSILVPCGRYDPLVTPPNVNAHDQRGEGERRSEGSRPMRNPESTPTQCNSAEGSVRRRPPLGVCLFLSLSQSLADSRSDLHAHAFKLHATSRVVPDSRRYLSCRFILYTSVTVTQNNLTWRRRTSATGMRASLAT